MRISGFTSCGTRWPDDWRVLLCRAGRMTSQYSISGRETQLVCCCPHLLGTPLMDRDTSPCIIGRFNGSPGVGVSPLEKVDPSIHLTFTVFSSCQQGIFVISTHRDSHTFIGHYTFVRLGMMDTVLAAFSLMQGLVLQATRQAQPTLRNFGLDLRPLTGCFPFARLGCSRNAARHQSPAGAS